MFCASVRAAALLRDYALTRDWMNLGLWEPLLFTTGAKTVPFLFTPGRVTINIETYSVVRRVYTDGRSLPKDPRPAASLSRISGFSIPAPSVY